jgi:uncharacterized repeat protein (TIGR02543 family)
MKKILIAIAMFAMVLTLSACTDQKYETDKANVLFFTANFGSTPVDPYIGVEPGSLIEEPAAPSRPGFTFNGWYKDYQWTDPWDFDTDTVGEDSIILYAGWIPMTFSIIYDLNGGSMVQSTWVTTFQPGDNKVLPQASLTGYTFVAWYTYDWVDESSTIPGDPGYQSLPKEQYEDLYLYAHYEPVSARVSFRVNYPEETGGPEAPSSVTMDYGTVIDFDPLPDTDDYTFIGWNTRPDGSGDFYINGDLFDRTQRITLYGVWEPKN